MNSRGTEILMSLEHDTDRLRLSSARDVAGALDELRAIESVPERAVLLAEWAIELPNATSQLLRVVAGDPAIAAELAPTVLGTDLGEDGLIAHNIDAVLVSAFPRLAPPFRDAAVDRAGVRAQLLLPVGHESVPRPDPSWLWPRGKPFPPADTVEGAQARLNFRALGAGPIDGTWNERTRRAFVRWQVLNGFEPTGELDESMIDELRLAFPDAPG